MLCVLFYSYFLSNVTVLCQSGERKRLDIQTKLSFQCTLEERGRSQHFTQVFWENVKIWQGWTDIKKLLMQASCLSVEWPLLLKCIPIHEQAWGVANWHSIKMQNAEENLWDIILCLLKVWHGEAKTTRIEFQNILILFLKKNWQFPDFYCKKYCVFRILSCIMVATYPYLDYVIL